jgi:2-oxoglutarate ferredoxin oxidoreductase subunit beta
MKMTVMLLDNHISGLTKMQTSPTSPQGNRSNTHPLGVFLGSINPLAVTLGVTNASFVAQTVDWNPPHLYATLKAAHNHDGLAFVRILQRCPHYMPQVFEALQQDSSLAVLLTHPDGIQVDEDVARMFKVKEEHDPRDILRARFQAERSDGVVLGLLYRNDNAQRYHDYSVTGLGMSASDKIDVVQETMDRFLV